MNRLVAVSNRLPFGRPNHPSGELEIPAGGVVSALLAALQKSRENLWFGWDGRMGEESSLSNRDVRGVRLLGTALSRREVQDFYLGFCNEALWPLLHCFQGRVRFEPQHVEAYLNVQRRFADVLVPHLRDDDLVWIHDYQLLLVGTELRRRGFRGRLGFFLHTPFPPYDLWALLPDNRMFLEGLLAHDLVGFHTKSYVENFAACCQRELSATWDGESVSTLDGKRVEVGVYPVGIEPSDFALPSTGRRRARRTPKLSRLAGSQCVLLGVDRLDYTKGLGERFSTIERFLIEHPEWRERMCLIQIASPSRSALPWYEREKSAIESLAGRINSELGAPDWTPIRYLYRNFQRAALARFYRGADVGFVTPLRDGMNLVAKEFVAAQDPDRPGVLVLSRFAGAAEDLEEAIQVNPFSPSETAEALVAALTMPVEERKERHAALLARVVRNSASAWAKRFTRDLAGLSVDSFLDARNPGATLSPAE